VLCIDYRFARKHPFRAALDDAVAAYRWLLAQRADPKRIAPMVFPAVKPEHAVAVVKVHAS